MIDTDLIRTNPDRIRIVARQKKVSVDVDYILELDQRRRKLRTQLDDIQRQRNELARGLLGQPDGEAIERGRELKQQSSALNDEVSKVSEELKSLLWQVPNIPSADTPVGDDESANVTVRQVGDKPQFNFTPRPHWELGEALNLIDTERAAEVAGSRFVYLKNELVLLQFALIQHALSVLTDADKLAAIAQEAKISVPNTAFMPVIVPVMIRPEVMARMGRLEPEGERYFIPSDNLYLAGSAEHTLGPMHMDEQLAAKDLPRRYVGYSTSFRREAGSHGRDVRGILRLHQFDKLEIESFTTPETSDAEQEFIVAIQEHLMQSLGLPYRVVLKCTADMGGPNYRAIDIETWMPGQRDFRETHTSDHMSDYQARRLRTKVALAGGGSSYVHMNDATVFAIGRTLIAIMENYQQADGSIMVPEALRAYVSFAEIKK